MECPETNNKMRVARIIRNIGNGELKIASHHAQRFRHLDGSSIAKLFWSCLGIFSASSVAILHTLPLSLKNRIRKADDVANHPIVLFFAQCLFGRFFRVELKKELQAF